jgi:hypothetical protein
MPSHHHDDEAPKQRKGFFITRDQYGDARPNIGNIVKTTLGGLGALTLAFASVDYVDGKHIGLVHRMGMPERVAAPGTWVVHWPFIEGTAKFQTTRDDVSIGEQEMRVRFKDGVQDYGAIDVAYKVRPNATFTGLSKLYLDFHGDTDAMARQKTIQGTTARLQRVNSYELDVEQERIAVSGAIQAHINNSGYPIDVVDVTIKGFGGDQGTEAQKRELSRQRMQASIIQQQIENADDAKELALRQADIAAAAYAKAIEKGLPPAQFSLAYCLSNAATLEGDAKALAIAGCGGGNVSVLAGGVKPTVNVQVPPPPAAQ